MFFFFFSKCSDGTLYYMWQVYSVCLAAPTLIRPVIKISPSQSAAETRQAFLSRRYGGAFHTWLATDVFCRILIYCLIDYSSHHKSASEWDQTAKDTKSTKDWLAHYFRCWGGYWNDTFFKMAELSILESGGWYLIRCLLSEELISTGKKHGGLEVSSGKKKQKTCLSLWHERITRYEIQIYLVYTMGYA